MSLGSLNNCGKSFGYEAMMLVINYLFNTRKILYIEVDTAVFNERAMRCFYKCGFRTVKDFTDTEYVTKVKTRKTLFRITRKDFMPKYEEYIKKIQEKV
jgi:RimJ/RimL family protein N-acetyltransferase